MKGTSELMKNNVVDFEVARQGLIGGPTTDENWLKNLERGTMFLCKRRNTPKDMQALELYLVIEHKTLTTNLVQKIPTGQQADLWVETLDFSRTFRFVETIMTVGLDYEQDIQEETKSETTDGNSEGTV